MIQVRWKQCLHAQIIACSCCILGNGRHGNLEHRQRGCDSVLRIHVPRLVAKLFRRRRHTVFRFAISILIFQYYCNFFDV